MARKYRHITNCFEQGEKYRLHQMLSLCDSFDKCVYGIEINQNDKRFKCSLPVCSSDNFSIASLINAHQKRILKTILQAFLSRVTALSYSSRQSADFEDLFEYVASNSGLSKKHCLLVYDFCLRKGYHLDPQVLPDKYVYLFRGAKEGAEVVFGKSYRGYKLPTAMLQSALDTNMTSFEIEHLLCVCKNCLQKLGPISMAERTKLEAKYIVQKKRLSKRQKVAGVH